MAATTRGCFHSVSTTNHYCNCYYSNAAYLLHRLRPLLLCLVVLVAVGNVHGAQTIVFDNVQNTSTTAAAPAAIADDNERAVLLQFYKQNSASGQLWKVPWLASSTNHCQEFAGISCNPAGEVTAIVLPNNNLSRTIPLHSLLLPGLPALQILDVHDNPIDAVDFVSPSSVNSGGLSFSSLLASLTYLDLSDTLVYDISGIDTALPNLQVFKWSQNKPSTMTAALQRPFPISVCNLSALQALHLHNTALSGTLGTEIGKLRNLRELLLYGNTFIGSIPSEVGNLVHLQSLSLSDNYWTGTLPDSMQSLTALTMLSLKGRASSSSSSSSTGGGAARGITGTLPAWENLSNLNHLFLSNQQLTGSIPDNFLLRHRAAATAGITFSSSSSSKNPRDQSITIDLQQNRLTGTLPASLAVRFGDGGALNLILTRNPNLRGPLPESFCSQSRWMSGAVAEYGCDAILCPAGTHSATGQAPCSPCSTSADTAPAVTAAAAAAMQSQLGMTQCPEASALDPSQQMRVLAELYVALDGPNSWAHKWSALDDLFAKMGVGVDGGVEMLNQLEDALDAMDVCQKQFFGILCNTAGWVELLTLPKNSMVGTVPTDFFARLPHLVAVDFSNNNNVEFSAQSISAITPVLIPKLSRLRLSHTAVQSFVGFILPNLQELYLDGCNFQDAGLPSGLFAFTNLHTLFLQSSFLAGTIPSEIRLLSDLRRYVGLFSVKI
jgi:Leucine-rich repeat (LRR) protein